MERVVRLDDLYSILNSLLNVMMDYPEHKPKASIFRKSLQASYDRVSAESETGSISSEAVEEIRDLQFEICGWADLLN